MSALTTDTPVTAAPPAAPDAGATAAADVAAPAAAPEPQPAAAVPAAADPTPAPAAPAAAAPEAQQQQQQTEEAAQKTEEKPAEKAQTPLTSLYEKLPAILAEANHNEMWGVQLSDSSHIPTTVVLQKYLRANDDDVSKAADQLQQALVWRRDTNPGKLLDEVAFDKKKFDELGYVTTHKDAQGKETIITWNIYGTVKNNKATFGDVDEFIKWRAALMELSVRKLNLDKVLTPIPDGGEDPYQMVQVHDYLNVSFLRMDPAVKAASSQTIKIFAMAYPELLVHKYFVNIPALMGWVFKAMKVFLAPKTIAKFHPLGYGTELAGELPGLKDSLPKDYGGNGESIKTAGQTVKLADSTAPVESKPTADAPAVAAAATPVAETKAATEVPAPIAAETQAAETPAPTVAPSEPAVPQLEKVEDAAPVAEPVKTEASKTDDSELPKVADLSIKDQSEGKEEAKEGAKPAAA
ncbi:hypothetical protein EsH8_VIII_000840 [Colletotrichum jinshuiense]